jgi:hypothetical protein
MGCVDHNDIGVVAYEPNVVSDCPTAAVECKRAMGNHAFDAGHLQHHHRPQHLAGVHLVKGLLDVIDADALADEALQWQPALQI